MDGEKKAKKSKKKSRRVFRWDFGGFPLRISDTGTARGRAIIATRSISPGEVLFIPKKELLIKSQEYIYKEIL